jgi:hypothetical protein
MYHRLNRAAKRASPHLFCDALESAQLRSDLQDFGACVQSSQIGPHLVQPFSASPKAITPDINNRRSIIDPVPAPRPDHGPQACHFQAEAPHV